jgi:uncharacterized tellurite resistance protein B-like protein
MFGSIREFLQERLGGPDASAQDDGPSSLELAAAVLMVEISLADSSLEEAERRVIETALQQEFGLSEPAALALIDAAEREVDRATSLYEFTRLINDEMTKEDKIHVIRRLWEVAFADAVLDKYEEYYIRKIADLLYVPHTMLMREKHRAAGD